MGAGYALLLTGQTLHLDAAAACPGPATTPRKTVRCSPSPSPGALSARGKLADGDAGRSYVSTTSLLKMRGDVDEQLYKTWLAIMTNKGIFQVHPTPSILHTPHLPASPGPWHPQTSPAPNCSTILSAAWPPHPSGTNRLIVGFLPVYCRFLAGFLSAWPLHPRDTPCPSPCSGHQAVVVG